MKYQVSFQVETFFSFAVLILEIFSTFKEKFIISTWHIIIIIYLYILTFQFVLHLAAL